MNISIQKNIPISNPNTRTFLADFFVPESQKPLPLVVFCHGYKGYKDWGAWNLMAEKITSAGFCFVKFNFSHNGTSMDHPTHFIDLEAFGNDNFTKQLSDLDAVIDYFIADERVDGQEIILIGHSRGGGVATIKAGEDKRIKKLITLAGVDHLDFFPKGERLSHWMSEGVFYSFNARTQQEMPHYIQLYHDFQQHSSRFNVGNHARAFHGKSLVIHGEKDEAVTLKAAENLHLWLKGAQLCILKDAQHTFGAKEPWDSKVLPIHLEHATALMISFLKG
ncbi:MAG: alpha/beta fold hydrolase [Bacteroidetes bacterium]|nr:alpha/beta fold hydrolase [Bacteroidota bacterium]